MAQPTRKHNPTSRMEEGDILLDLDEESDEDLDDESDEDLDEESDEVSNQLHYLYELDEKFDHAFQYDRKDIFMNLLNRYKLEEVAGDIWSALFECDAVNCLASVLKGEAAGICDINVNAVPFACYDGQLVPILHKAARHGALEIIKMCLPGNEAQLNLRVDVDGMKGVLPLNLALKNFWLCVEARSFQPPHHRIGDEISAWISDPLPTEPERLVFKWIFHLCNPCWKTNAEVVRLLASKTFEIEQEILKYLKDRKLFELTALLMFARDSIMHGLEGGCKIRDIVLKEIANLKIFILRSNYDVGGDMLMFEAKKKKMEMEAILLLLEIFDRIGHKIDAYLHYSKGDKTLDMVKEVSWLLKQAGFDAELELLDEIHRSSVYTCFLGIEVLDTPKDKRFEGSTIETGGLTNNASGGLDEKENPYHRAFDKAIINESKQGSSHWLVNKQEMLSLLNIHVNHLFSLRPYHTHHFVRHGPGFSSTITNKVCQSDFSCQSYQLKYSFGRAKCLGSTSSNKVNNGTVLKLQLKNQYQDSSKSAQRTGVCHRASNLQLNRGWISSVNSSLRILWNANKRGRVL